MRVLRRGGAGNETTSGGGVSGGTTIIVIQFAKGGAELKPCLVFAARVRVSRRASPDQGQGVMMRVQ